MEVGKMPAQRKTNQSRGLTAAGLIAVTAATLLMMVWAIFPTPAMATHVTPVFVEGNPTCGGNKFDPPSNGTHNVPGFGSITVSNANGSTFDWSSTFGVDSVIVKGGPNANVYTYDPPAEAFGDTGLHAPLNDNTPNQDDFFGLSHIEFCFDKDVTPNLDISKEVSDTTVDEGGAFSYTITVKNTGDASATNVVVTDDLDDNLMGVSVVPSQGKCDLGAGNTIECELGTLAAGDSATVTINANAPQLPLTEGGLCEISIANTASVDSDETDEVSDEAPPVTVTGTECETTTTTTPPGGGGGGGTTTTPPPAPTTTTTTPPAVAPTTIHNTSTTPAAEVLPTTVRPGKLAFTGIEDVVPIGALALTLMTTGSGLLWAGSRRRRHDGSKDED
jgi:uncharacterized repeat protein (TIGR01451 family)